jgi:hypothetical protein
MKKKAVKQTTFEIFFRLKAVVPQPCTSKNLTKDMQVAVSSTADNCRLPSPPPPPTNAQFLIYYKTDLILNKICQHNF